MGDTADSRRPRRPRPSTPTPTLPSQQQHRERKRRRGPRQTPAAAVAPSSAFLAALEAQRAKEAAAASHAPTTTTDQATAATTRDQAPAAALPGFYYDADRGRYFRLTDRQRLQQRRGPCPQRPQPPPASVASHRCRPRPNGNDTSRGDGSGWLRYLAERTISSARDPRRVLHRDHRELLRRFVGARMADATLVALDLPMDAAGDRLTAIDVHSTPEASTLAVGFASGRLVLGSLAQTRTIAPPRAEQLRRRPMLRLVAETPSSPFLVTSLRWHPSHSHLLWSGVGAGAGGLSSSELVTRSGQHLGCVQLQADGALGDQRSMRWALRDPWTVEWCPTQETTFSVGVHGSVGAVAIDIGATATLEAPQGKSRSDVLAQSFAHASAVVLNGTRSGDLWLWDLRASRRCLETHAPRAPTVAASIAAIELLRDERRVLIQQSHGALSMLDLRGALDRPVRVFGPGTPQRYHPTMQFGLSEDESFVAAGSTHDDDAVRVFDLASDRVHAIPMISMAPEAVAVAEETAAWDVSARESVAHVQVAGVADGGGLPALWGMSRRQVLRAMEPPPAW